MIRQDMFDRQRKVDPNAGRWSNVDYVWDVPVTLAQRITGYRHDHWRYDWGTPAFVEAMRSVP
jgi:hypothetical protein